MRQRAAASLLYQSQHAEPAFRNLQNLIFLKIVGRILAFYNNGILTLLDNEEHIIRSAYTEGEAYSVTE